MKIELTTLPVGKTYDVILKQENSKLTFIYGDNGDLYISCYAQNKRAGANRSFFIKKDDELFLLFEKFYRDIIMANIWEGDEFKQQNERVKKLSSAYKSLVKGEYVELFSDSAPIEEANTLSITRSADGISFVFTNNANDLCKNGVRISNSGSRYAPFNVCFMRLYNNLKSQSVKEEERE